MVRKHGWQLPAHSFQVVAITVFCLLVVAFYAFFAPFLGRRIWEYVLVCTYTPVAFLVFILYIRCTAINPADPGIMSKFDARVAHTSFQNHGLSSKGLHSSFGDGGGGIPVSPSSASKSSVLQYQASRRGSDVDVERPDADITPRTSMRRSSCGICGIFCAVFVVEDCCKESRGDENQNAAEDALFCTLCNSEVRKFSKHCRTCDKCVDGFDHHCRWLNNCVGRKNYISFISLMAISLVWLVMEAGVGIGVMVRCFVSKKSMEADIVDKLGNGFSRIPFACVVVVCTAVSMLACVPLGELFFFHMLLIRKGITTYEYVVALRAMSEAPAGESVANDLGNIEMLSPSGSAATGMSGGSSLGLQIKGAWCTPPRVFVDYQDEVVPHLEPGRVPSTIDPDESGMAERGPKGPKKAVRISAWKLAKLDSSEAMRAAAKARASSSVLRPIDHRHPHDSTDASSSGNLSMRSSVSTDMGLNKGIENDPIARMSQFKNAFPPSEGSRDECETGSLSMSSVSSPGRGHEPVMLSPLPPQTHGYGPYSTSNNMRNVVPSCFESEKAPIGGSTDPLVPSVPAHSLLREVKRTSVVWDQEAGRYISVPVSATEGRNRPPIHVAALNTRTAEGSSNIGRKPAMPQKEASSSSNLTYTGNSIFFGGPLLSVPSRDILRNESGSAAREALERLVLNMPPREVRIKKDSVSNQLPVFTPGGGSRNNPWPGGPA
ncbi:hypothetical protein MLD38_030052 [Melastoma candidum]|uniref:Uncharacterized protein n=2 Tax=Melastoma candidum TaxID=119954 RepID=A0ACB9MKI7_9MYRT|nr:hypothetical protein MLD38_030052 [Melastoma candidum]